MGNLKLICFILFFNGLITSGIYSQNRIIKGEIIDKDSKEVIKGATVSIEKGSKTISDIKGEFRIITSNNSEKEIELLISSIGYTTAKISAKPGKVLTISLEKDIKALDEVLISVQGKNIVKEAILKIKNNYPSHNMLATGVMRITELVDTSYYYKGDARISVFLPSYSSKTEKQQVSIDYIERNYLEDSTKKWFLRGKWVGGFSRIHDIIFTRPDFLQLSQLDKFIYRTPTKKVINGRVTYEISFISKKENKVEGVLEIDSNVINLRGVKFVYNSCGIFSFGA